MKVSCSVAVVSLRFTSFFSTCFRPALLLDVHLHVMEFIESMSVVNHCFPHLSVWHVGRVDLDLCGLLSQYPLADNPFWAPQVLSKTPQVLSFQMFCEERLLDKGFAKIDCSTRFCKAWIVDRGFAKRESSTKLLERVNRRQRFCKATARPGFAKRESSTKLL